MIDSVPSEVARGGDKWQGQSQQSWRPCCLLCLRKLREQQTYRGVTRLSKATVQYTTTFVIKEKGSGLGSTVTGSVNWGIIKRVLMAG
jgi:hypothetical protein